MGSHRCSQKFEQAEGVGFEPTVPEIETTVFKTVTISRSVTPPRISIHPLFYNLKPGVGVERLWYGYAAIGLLIVLHYSDEHAGQSKP